jgi:NADPH2:quinone reductase
LSGESGKAKTKAFVIVTALRPESREWCLNLGADLVIDHKADPLAQLKSANIPHVDMVLSTAGTASYIGQFSAMLRPLGHLPILDVTASLDASARMQKSASVHLEMVFSKILHGHGLRSQGDILKAVAVLVVEDLLRPSSTMHLNGLTPETAVIDSSLVIPSSCNPFSMQSRSWIAGSTRGSSTSTAIRSNKLRILLE